LVVGETATFTEITVSNGGSKEDVDSGYTLKTSNAGVVSKDDTQITAEAPGTATITITYGDVTKDVSIKVVNDAREVEKVRVKNSDDEVITSIKVIVDVNTDVTVEALDQYGDPMPGEVNDAASSNEAVLTLDEANLDDDLLTLQPVDEGKATVSFYDADGDKIGSLTVTVSDNTDVAKKVLELVKPATDDAADELLAAATKADFTTDSTIDVSDDQYAALVLNEYNSDNISVGGSTDIDIDWLESKDDVVDVYGADNFAETGKIIVEGLKAGTATIKITDNETGKLYTKKFTVVDEGYSIKSVDFKSIPEPTYVKTYSYSTALTTTSTGNDPIVKGVTLNKATSQAIRLDPSNGQLYIDKDADGTYTAGDTDLGTLEIVTTGTIGGVGAQTITDVDTGITTEYGDDGTIIFKVWNADHDKVLDSTSVNVEL